MIAVFIGYLASILLALSLMVNGDLKFRWFNSLGCISFIAYGVMINAFPVILTNALLLLINAIYLIKAYKRKEDFELVEFNPGEKIISKFLQFYKNDIQAFFPEFALAGNDNDIRFIVLRDMAIANIFIAEVTADGCAFVKINYTVPKYRDYKVGTFIFEKERSYLISKGVKKIVYKTIFNKNHESFLRRMQFTKSYNTNEVLVKNF